MNDLAPPRSAKPTQLKEPVRSHTERRGISAPLHAFSKQKRQSRSVAHTVSFCATITVATTAGIALNFTSLDPVEALYWSTVVNGILAAPVMAVMMMIVKDRPIES